MQFYPVSGTGVGQDDLGYQAPFIYFSLLQGKIQKNKIKKKNHCKSDSLWSYLRFSISLRDE